MTQWSGICPHVSARLRLWHTVLHPKSSLQHFCMFWQTKRQVLTNQVVKCLLFDIVQVYPKPKIPKHQNGFRGTQIQLSTEEMELQTEERKH